MVCILIISIFCIRFLRKIILSIIINILTIILSVLILKSSNKLLMICGIERKSIINIKFDIWCNKHMLFLASIYFWYSSFLSWCWGLSFFYIFKLLRLYLIICSCWFNHLLIYILFQFKFFFKMVIKIRVINITFIFKVTILVVF